MPGGKATPFCRHAFIVPDMTIQLAGRLHPGEIPSARELGACMVLYPHQGGGRNVSYTYSTEVSPNLHTRVAACLITKVRVLRHRA